MMEAIRTRNPWKTAAMMLLAILVLLVVALAPMLRPAATTGLGGRAVHPAVHATSAGGSGGRCSCKPLYDPTLAERSTSATKKLKC